MRLLFDQCASIITHFRYHHPQRLLADESDRKCSDEFWGTLFPMIVPTLTHLRITFEREPILKNAPDLSSLVMLCLSVNLGVHIETLAALPAGTLRVLQPDYYGWGPGDKDLLLRALTLPAFSRLDKLRLPDYWPPALFAGSQSTIVASEDLLHDECRKRRITVESKDVTWNSDEEWLRR